jgi:N-acetylglucosaminyldiphosphoundecaprenol N-acetyl-beta-D-mannosaminyltransferase
VTPDGTDLRVVVLDVHVSAVDLAGAVRRIGRWIEEDRRQYVCVTGVHGVMESQHDPALLRIHNDSGLTTPDGMPMVWAGRWAGVRSMQRVYGPDLMLAVCERAAERGWSSYFYGGRERVAEKLAARLAERFPGLRVVGVESPPFRPLTEREDGEVANRINAAHADIVWVGLSTPKQERWMASQRARLNAKVLIGVGAAFDIHAGELRQAPRWMQRRGLEWLFRMIMEPKRLGPRYLKNNPAFVWAIVRRRPHLVTREVR